MVNIKLIRSGSGVLESVVVEGHAGFGDAEHGGDIVCSAVSALVGFLGITFSEVLPDAGEVRAGDGFFELLIKEEGSAKVTLEAWVLAVKGLEDNYRGWVKVVEEK